VVDRDPKAKQLTAMVVVAHISRVDQYREVLHVLGLRLSRLTLAAAAMTPLVKPLLPPAALIVRGHDTGVELLSFRDGNLRATQSIPLEPGVSVTARFDREWHRALAALPSGEPESLPRFVCGPVPAAFLNLLEGASILPAPKLKLARANKPGDWEWPALGAAYGALRGNTSPSINLLPQEQRWQPRPAVRPPAYALGATAALLALTLGAHGWIERALYGRAMNRALQRLAAPAQQVRRQERESSAIEARAAVLANLQTSNWQKLRLLEQLTNLLPEGTWLQELHIGEDTVEIYGFSDRAADLVPPLENSPYFAQVEFTAPITRDNKNKEIFRIRMRLKHAATNKE
jgi:Tfp pilus assembly protein PilN